VTNVASAALVNHLAECFSVTPELYRRAKEKSMTVSRDDTGTRVAADESYTLVGIEFHLVLVSSQVDGVWMWNDINGYGNALNNRIDGNPGVNVIWGYGGNDLLYSGGGNDSVYGGDGDDQIFAGSDEDDPVIGGNGPIYDVDYIEGGAGNDDISGGDGADVMDGGTGDDMFGVEDAGDEVIERADEGWDLVIARIDYVLPANVEELQMEGDAIEGTGNDLFNMMMGTDANNILDGGAGADELEGGLGDDLYLVDDVGDLVLEEAQSGHDCVEATASHVLGENVEDLTLMGDTSIDGTGNGLDNVITGNTGDNVLDGSGGSDTLSGGLGNDTYVVDTTLDSIVEAFGGGGDLVIASVNWTLAANLEHLQLSGIATVGVGNADNNDLFGNQWDNQLDGLGGTDRLFGGEGNDTYFINDNLDSATELVDEGIDTVRASVSFALGANIEKLLLTGTAVANGTGNAQANSLEGNASNNVLDGKAGADTMIGGAGSDTYVVDNGLDRITETTGNLATGGTDLVIASVSHVLSANVENLRLGAGAINGTGNGASNVIYAGTGNNVLNGGGGVDTASYLNATAGVMVSLLPTAAQATGGSGTDKLSGFENLQGSNHADRLSGNAGANALDGGLGNDTLAGGAGNDQLAGGAGLDAFRFDTRLSATGNVDTLRFVARDDTIQLENAIFTRFATAGVGPAAANFKANAAGLATDANDYIVYETDTGKLFYDADGNGSGAAVHFATLVGAPPITVADFFVI
jgi:Ca2+-binding RTX toxin-like protein